MWGLKSFFPSALAPEQLHAIFNGLRTQIPLLYAACIVNLIGMHIAIGGAELLVFSPATVMSAVLLWRAGYWAFFQRPTTDVKTIQSELFKVLVFATLLCTGFSIWAQLLMTRYPDLILVIAIFNLLAALGAAYGLSSFPRAGLLPLTIIGLPVAARLLFLDDSLTRAMGFSLLLTIFFFLRLLRTHSRALAGLIESRMSVLREHNRAIFAEVAALKRAEEDDLTGLPNRSKLSPLRRLWNTPRLNE